MASNEVLHRSSQLPAAVGALQLSVGVSSGRHLVHLSGELDLASAPTLVEVVDRLLAGAGANEIVVDIELVSFIDSSGLHAFLSCLAKCEAAGITFLLTPGTRQAKRLFEITGVHLPFICPDHPPTRAFGSHEARPLVL